MKNFLLFLLGAVVGLAIYHFVVADVDVQDEEAQIRKPSGVITPQQAKVLNDNWTEYRKAANDSAAVKQNARHKEDNRSAWWSIEDIEDYIAYSKNQLKEDLNTDLDGFRIYLGVYSRGQSENSEFTTMFWVPTAKKPKDSDGSFNFFNYSFQGGGGDTGGNPLNSGHTGNPPGSGYGGS